MEITPTGVVNVLLEDARLLELLGGNDWQLAGYAAIALEIQKLRLIEQAAREAVRHSFADPIDALAMWNAIEALRSSLGEKVGEGK
jgi:hypothetical protein